MEFLSRNEIPFVAKDVRKDRAALRELAELGSQGTPTLVIGDEVVIGFDQDRILELVKRAGGGPPAGAKT
jgi:hypothetical protein